MKDTPISQPRSIVLLVSLLCAVWILSGLVGHDPWKPDEAYSFGLVLSLLEGRDWVVPMLAGEPFMEKPPVYFLTAALTARAFQSALPLHDAARLATGLYMALTFVVVGLTSRELFGRDRGWIATLMLVGSVGLLVCGHQLLTDVAQLAGFALAFYGLALGLRRPRLGGLWLGTGIGLALMSKGLLAPGCLSITAILLPVLSRRWRTRDYAGSLLIAFLTSLPWLLIWPALLYHRSPELFTVWFWDNNFGRFLGRNNLGPPSGRLDVVTTLAWFALPAWPLAVRALWQARRDLPSRPELLLPLTGCAAIFAVLSASRQVRDVYALPILVPISLLAVPGLLSLGHRAAKTLSGITITLFLGLALAVWIFWAGLDLGLPRGVHEYLLRFQPAYVPSVDAVKVGLPIAMMAAWAWIVLQFPGGPARPAVMWAGGMTVVWGLVAVLFVGYANTGNSYRVMVAEIKSRLPSEYDCMASHGLGEPQRAMLEYFAGILTHREENAAPAGRGCNVLLVQGFRSQIYRPSGPWVKVWEGSRPGDRKELYKLYKLSDPVAASQGPVTKGGWSIRLAPNGPGHTRV